MEMVAFLLLSASIGNSFALLTTSPRNTAVVIGSRVILNCSSTESADVIWNLEGEKVSVESKGDISQTKRIIRTPDGTADLVIFAVQMTDAGTYRCFFFNNDMAQAELTVLAGSLQCTTNVSAIKGPTLDNQLAQFTCMVTYNGGWAPLMEWQLVDVSGNKSILQGSAEEQVGTNQKTIHQTLDLRVTSNLNGYRIRCFLFFDASTRPSSPIADNVPSYNDTWEFDQFDIAVPGQNQMGYTSVVPIVIGCLTGLLVVIGVSIAATLLCRKYECECIVPNTPDLIASNSTVNRPNGITAAVDYAQASVMNFSIGHPDSERSVITLEIPDNRVNVQYAGPMYAEMCSVQSNRSPRLPRRRNEQMEMYAEISHRTNVQ